MYLSPFLMFARLVGRVPTAHLWYLLRRMRFEKPHRFAARDSHGRVVRQTRINTFFPPYPSPAFDRFCRAVIARRRVPYSVYLAVTDACPYRCPHCSYAGRSCSVARADSPAKARAAGLDPAESAESAECASSNPAGHPVASRQPLSRAQMLSLIEQIKQLGTATIGFTGGEPLLCDDLEDFVAAAGPEMAGIVFTTGHGLTPERAARLAAAGAACITLGIESADAKEHDVIRAGPGSFEQAQAAARACREAGLYLAISTIATRERIASGALERMYQLGRQWGAGEFRVLSPVATGAWRGCGAVMLAPDERRRLVEFHVEHNRRKDGPAVNTFAYLESDELFGCGAGFHHLFIDAGGNVCPCDLTPLSFGDATHEPLVDIWERMGANFGTPRRGCLMAEVGPCMACDEPLPIPPERSTHLCRPPSPDMPLPEGYRRLFR